MQRKGLNRFVWDLRHEGLPGSPKVYIEGSYSGRKAVPGTYTLKLTQGNQSLNTQTEIIPNPVHRISQEEYTAYDEFMSLGEANFTEMTRMTNTLYKNQKRLGQLLKRLNEEGYTSLFQR